MISLLAAARAGTAPQCMTTESSSSFLLLLFLLWASSFVSAMTVGDSLIGAFYSTLSNILLPGRENFDWIVNPLIKFKFKLLFGCCFFIFELRLPNHWAIGILIYSMMFWSYLAVTLYIDHLLIFPIIFHNLFSCSEN